MAQYSNNIREEEVKNRLRQDYFSAYDATPILGNVDFAVAVPAGGERQPETEYLLWAEAKEGTRHDICESFVQLILTIGKARTFDRHLPPAFLGAFDAEKIAFIPYNAVLDVFYQNDFNWNVTPSDHSTREFRQVMELVSQTIDKNQYRFYYEKDDRELRRFIRQNFVVGKSRLSKIRISKNNFVSIYQKWRKEVMPSINIDWETAKQAGIIDAHFYLADILSKDNATLKEKLYVVLLADHYVLDRRINDTGLKEQKIAEFHDGQKAHTLFWNRYNRPPRREYWDYIVERIDLLVPQDVRERKGSYFTPQQWVELSQQYIADELGDDWQDEYTVWDCCAGTGNLLVGLTNKYNIWASDIDRGNIAIMRDRIANGANLLDSHVFQFDFLNDSFDKLPQPLQDIINDPERRRKLVIYINPPYAEASDTKTLHGGAAKNAVEQTATNKKYKKMLGQGNAELFAQFFIRIYHEIPTCVLAEFSKLKILQGPHFENFRTSFRAKLGRIFCVPANTFDNVKGDFPIGFFVWRTDVDEEFSSVVADFYDKDGNFLQKKTICAYKSEHFMNEWLKPHRAGKNEKGIIGKMPFLGNDFQHQRYVQIVQESMVYCRESGQFLITANNLRELAIYFAVRKCIEPTWLNDRDQFLYPNDGWQTDYEFQADCLVYTLFNNNIQSQYGVNHWIPFTEAEVDAKEKFKSHFMTDYLSGKVAPSCSPRGGESCRQMSLFEAPSCSPRGGETGAESLPLGGRLVGAVMDAGRELWRYYHKQENANPDASFYDIRLHFQGTKTTASGKVQMKADSDDTTYTELIKELRERLKLLARKIEPKVYEYGFLKK